MKFQVGDKVSAFGIDGVVNLIDEASIFPVNVTFDNKFTAFFTAEGFYQTWHLEPSLTLVERPKKMEKRTIERWVNQYDNNAEYLHNTEKSADGGRTRGFIRTVKLTGEYEVEVE